MRISSSVGVGVVPQEGRQRDDDAGRAEPALEPVVVLHGLLHVVERPVGVGHALDRGDLGPVHLGREQQARAHRCAVDQHRAGSARPVLAADVGPGEVQVLPQHVREQLPRLARDRSVASVDGHAT